MTNTTKIDAFLSYKSEDINQVRLLANDLKSLGFNPWYAKSQLKSGHWRSKVEDAIDSSAVFILVVSKSTGTSVEVENEFRRAQAIHKQILPIFVEECNPPLYAQALHAILYADPNRNDLIKSFIDFPIGLQALESFDFHIAKEDDTGGSGANFVVVINSETSIPKPIVEAIMLGSHGQHGFSFVSKAVSIKKKKD